MVLTELDKACYSARAERYGSVRIGLSDALLILAALRTAPDPKPPHLREPPHCSTCECWKADMQPAPEPADEAAAKIERLKRENAQFRGEILSVGIRLGGFPGITGLPDEPAIPVSILREHWLTGVECDHEAKTDVATCYCSRWRSAPQPNIPAAVNEWIKHLLEQQPAPSQPPGAGQ